MFVAGSIGPCITAVAELGELNDNGEPVTVPFNSYIDTRAEPPQYSLELPAQSIVHPSVWSLPETPEPESTLIVLPQ